MPASKIQNEQEVIRWFEEGRTYYWMVDTYRTKYNIETTPAMWGNFRRRRGLDPRIVRDDKLIPWGVKLEHRHSYPVIQLRREARRRAGYVLGPEVEKELEGWLRNLRESDLVVHYEPDTEEGWFYTKARPGIDKDLIREPSAQERTGRKATE